MRLLIILCLAFGAVIAAPRQSQRIVGGNPATISAYPEAASLLFSFTTANYRQACAGAILNNRSVMTAAHCTYQDSPARWRVRLGSTYANSNGTVFNTMQIITHNNFNIRTLDNDISIVRIAGNIVFVPNSIQPASIASSNYNLGDTQPVWAVGWGATQYGGDFSDQLRDVTLWTINNAICRTRYAELRMNISDNMLCTGLLDAGGRDQCQGDAGGPVYHSNRVVVGISSFGYGCGQPRFPGVNTRISSHTTLFHSLKGWTF